MDAAVEAARREVHGKLTELGCARLLLDTIKHRQPFPALSRGALVVVDDPRAACHF